MKKIYLYCILASFIIGWWTLAFRNSSSYSQSPYYKEINNQLTIENESLFSYLSSLQREALHRALAGDTRQMLHLITEWDIDAQILEEKGVTGIQRLEADSYLQAHLLCRLIPSSANSDFQLSSLVDDSGHLVPLKNKTQRFFPQTFVAASILLAIAHPNEIVAIPRGMRELPHLYPPTLLEKIPSNIHDLQGEKLFLTHPDLTFVSHYTHPPTLEALRNQKLELYTIKNIDTLSDIQETILKMGHATNHPLEANLLNIFIKACMLMLDNRFKALYAFHDQPQKFLFLYYNNQHYMLPTTKCLTGQLLKRVLVHYPHLQCPIIESYQEWRVPFEQEKIVKANPDCILICQPYHSAQAEQIRLAIAFEDLKAFKNHLIFYLDETVQESPNQYLVLAYFDLFQALAAAHLP